MAVKSIENYFSAFCEEYSDEIGEKKKYLAFTGFCAKYFYFFDTEKDVDTDFFDDLPDGANDGGIDAIFANPCEGANELVILQSKFYKKSTLGLQDFKDELNKIFDTISALREKKIGHLNKKITSAYFDAVNDLEDGFTTQIDFCISYQPTKKQIAEIEKAFHEKSLQNNVGLRLIVRDEILRQVVSCETATDIVECATLKLDRPNNALHYQGSIIVNVSAQSLQALYHQYKNRVLGRNLRYHIKTGSQAKEVDTGISKTIKEEPENFWFMNNGIIVTCDDYSLDENVITLRRFSIINGGQTTYKIAYAPDLSTDFYVQCKVVVSKGKAEKERDDFCLKIAKATNSQKPIKEADLRSNEPAQILLKKKLASLGFYYVTKAGDRPEKKIYKNYQITSLDKVGKASLAGILLMPGSARSASKKMFSPDIYETIFENALPRAITDLLTISYYYRQFLKKTSLNPDMIGIASDDQIQSLRNGATYILACVGFLAKIRMKVLSHIEFLKAREEGKDAVITLFRKRGDFDRVFVGGSNLSADDVKILEKLFLILIKKVISPCCKQARKIASTNAKGFDYSNYFKRDDSFIDDVVDELWSVYVDEDEGASLREISSKLFVG